MRPLSACVACRDRRKRCVRPRRGTSCTFCVRRGLRCIVEQKPAPALPVDGYEPLVGSRGDRALPISPSALMPDRELCDELVDLYFRYIHVTFHNLFHRPSFEAAVRDGTVPKILVFCVFSLSARFSAHPCFAGIDPQDRGRPYAREAERLLDLHKACLTTIQACILLGSIQVVEMDSTTESIYYTIACRLAMILDLPNAPAGTRLEQEVNLRVWWSVVTTDTWSSTALGLPRAIQPRYDIPLPMDERVFLRLSPTEPPVPRGRPGVPLPPGSDPSTSLIAQMIKLNGILYDINTFNTQAVSGALGEARVEERVRQLAAALDAWQSALPADMQYSAENLAYWTGLGCGPSFVVLHVNFNHSGQLLFYRFLHSSLTWDADGRPSLSDIATATRHRIGTASRRPDSVAAAYAARCKAHAAALCDIIYQCSSLSLPSSPLNNPTPTFSTTAVPPPPPPSLLPPDSTTTMSNPPPTTARNQGPEILYPLLGHMLVVASGAHLHALLFSADPAEAAAARRRLEHNFRVASRLRVFWPSLRASFSRLAAFHRAACLELGGAGAGGVGGEGEERDGGGDGEAGAGAEDEAAGWGADSAEGGDESGDDGDVDEDDDDDDGMGNDRAGDNGEDVGGGLGHGEIVRRGDDRGNSPGDSDCGRRHGDETAEGGGRQGGIGMEKARRKRKRGSEGGSTFRMDRWMLRFLLDFAKPVGEREAGGKGVAGWQGTG